MSPWYFRALCEKCLGNGCRALRQRRSLEVLVRGAVVAARKRRPLARLALAGRRLAACDAPVEQPGFELGLDERDSRVHALAHRPGDMGLCRDREVAADVLEEGAIRAREVVRVLGQARHRLLALAQHGTAVLDA